MTSAQHVHRWLRICSRSAGVLCGVILLHEQLSWQLLAGTFLIIASLAVVNGKPVSNWRTK